MIGNGGDANHALEVLKTGTARRFRIVAQRQEPDGSWSYRLDDNLMPIWVTGADPLYDVVPPVPLTPAEQAVSAFVAATVQAGPAGSVAAWVPAGDDPKAYAFDAAMGGYEISKGPAYILWSGGAADCVIVAAHSGQRGYLAHRDRQTPDAATLVQQVGALGAAPSVWLASSGFAAGADQAATNGLLFDTITALQAAGLVISGVYSTRQLALNCKTGAVLTQFDPNNPKLT